jgi:hypothetical protein
MDEPRKYYGKWKKLDTKGHIYEVSKIGKSIETENILVVTRESGKKGNESDY